MYFCMDGYMGCAPSFLNSASALLYFRSSFAQFAKSCCGETALSSRFSWSSSRLSFCALRADVDVGVGNLFQRIHSCIEELAHVYGIRWLGSAGGVRVR